MHFKTIALSAAVFAGLAATALSAAEKYTVALDGTFAPHAMPKLGGGIEGFNVDLANTIGERLGVEMDIVATQFSGILPGLQAGTYDFVVAPTTITEERANNLLFSQVVVLHFVWTPLIARLSLLYGARSQRLKLV